MNNEKRIPFDWEKYQSGEYEAICRANWKVDKIVNNPTAAKCHQVVFWVNGLSHSCSSEGLCLVNDELDLDLFLIPKPKKFQTWVNLYSNGQAVTWNNEPIAVQQQKSFESKSVKFVECRLIEWEA